MTAIAKATASSGLRLAGDRRALFDDIARTVCERFDLRGERDTTYIADTLASRLGDDRPPSGPGAWTHLDAAVFQLAMTYARQVLASERREMKDLIARALCRNARTVGIALH